MYEAQSSGPKFTRSFLSDPLHVSYIQCFHLYNYLSLKAKANPLAVMNIILLFMTKGQTERKVKCPGQGGFRWSHDASSNRPDGKLRLFLLHTAEW